ncbi:MAG: hypothetical protein JW841_03690 [Deltaproteobacteria bacterium]|nr:hypothetical protein [Deltaproteobacteria bacterium]
MDTQANEVVAIKKTINEEVFTKLCEHFKNGHLCLSDIAQIPMSELENIHQLARRYLLHQEYVRAAKIMKMLVHLYPYSSDFWGTYGIVLQRQEDYLKARMAYFAANEFDKKRPEWMVYAAECELMLQNPQFALDLIKPVFHLQIANANKSREMLKRAQRIKIIAENMESGPDDLDAIKARIKAS